MSYLFAFSYCSWGSQGKNTEVVCHSLLQWNTFCLYAAAAAKLFQSCLTLCDPIDGSPQALLSIGFSREEYWSELPFPSSMHACMHAKALQSGPTLCDPTDSSPPGPSVHWILRARILEWVATSFSIYGIVYREKGQEKFAGNH